MTQRNVAAALAATLGLSACLPERPPASAPRWGPPAVSTLSPAHEPPEGFTVQESPADDAAGRMCGGIAGLGCPEGHVCVDDATDDCDPGRGSQDCTGVCAHAGPPGAPAPP